MSMHYIFCLFYTILPLWLREAGIVFIAVCLSSKKLKNNWSLWSEIDVTGK